MILTFYSQYVRRKSSEGTEKVIVYFYLQKNGETRCLAVFLFLWAFRL
ncbi:hypothetical protein AB434_0815 [Heyndrickxia coagulans]|uniref:Uncharacterized protein n=1 Tax=Heyndrickxia coagulans TaxID=1398 RepID=A0A0C5C3J0_HEYCO|nr:hypothetical protein SB48_HM08orf00535 [Heyndrickxia coagulans]AKN53220.1 hypothetical protein AB434_0815 [Heyndrickxia coagulans]KWZ80354.1 hypothetical protein HMPREF3213_02340 [Heyndrickxia coagulans]